MPDEATDRNPVGLPPKLTARVTRPGAAQGSAFFSAGVQGAAGILANKKKDTSKLALEDARQVHIGVSAPTAQTVRLTKPGEGIGGFADAVPGIHSERKDDTSRVDLDSVVASVEPVTAATVPSGVNTVRIKSGPTAQAFVGTQSLAAGGVNHVSSGHDEGAAKPGTGPATIRLKRPDGIRQGSASHAGGETARISLESPVIGSDGQAQGVAPLSAAGPRTVRIRRPEEAGTSGGPTSPVTGRKTLKIARSPQAADGAVQEAEAGDDQPVTQRRTLSIKRQAEEPASDRSVRMAQDEAALGRQPGVPLLAGKDKPERAIWAWCLLNCATMIVIGLVIWVFLVQLLPKNERLNWPGRILGCNDAFFKDERGWL